jgi:hypothetical protein
MPATIPVHVALRTELRKSVSEALAFNERLEVLISVKSRQSGDNNFHGRIDFSQPPWNAQIANVVMDLHALARDEEAMLRLVLHLPSRLRGGSSENTAKALENIVRLCEGADDSSVRGRLKKLNAWLRRADIALGRTEMPRKLPRVEGEPERRCTFCEKHTLKMFPHAGEVYCGNPDCYDSEGRRPKAKLEFSPIVGDFVLVWQDNEVGLP